MATDTPRDVTMVPVKRYDISLSMDEILTPLAKTAGHLSRARMMPAENEEAARLMQRFTELVNELKSVTEQINRIDPSLLASKPGPPPGGSD